MISFIIFIFGFVFVQGDPIDFSDCGSDYKVLEIDIEGCKVIPCKLKMGTSYGIGVTLKPIYRSNTLSQEAYITLFNSIDIKIDVLPNPCDSLSCPVQISDGTKFKGSIVLGTNLMPTIGMLWWKMCTDTGNPAMCIKTKVQVDQKT